MSMSCKDYEALANAISEARQSAEIHYPDNTERRACKMAIDSVVDKICHVLHDDNKAFDSEHFRRAAS